ncbi:MAG: MarR family transcriptional regulator [Alphaproteobacteria bacterium]|nr:MAG: MarR family transcriptional regulator [Alphaproteobacteria bacterium]
MESQSSEQAAGGAAENAASEKTTPIGYDFTNSLFYHLASVSNRAAFGADPSNRRRFGINMREWRVLAVLGAFQPVTAADVVEVTGLDKATVSRALKDLERRHLVVRLPHPDDARARLLALTPDGVALNNRIVPEAQRQEKICAAGLSKAEQADLLRLLKKLSHHVRAVRAAPVEE